MSGVYVGWTLSSSTYEKVDGSYKYNTVVLGEVTSYDGATKAIEWTAASGAPESTARMPYELTSSVDLCFRRCVRRL